MRVYWLLVIALISATLLVSRPVVAQSAVTPDDLRAAAVRGELGRLKDAINARVPLDPRDGEGRTPLLAAVAAGQTAAALALIEAGADINAQAVNKDTPWLLAGALGRTEMLRAMIPKGPDFSIRNRFGGNALIPACERGHVETIELLLTTKIEVDHVNNLGWTCLLEIVILGDGGPRHVQATRLVLGAGANPNIADRDGVTPLTHARRRGQSEVAALIAGAGGR